MLFINITFTSIKTFVWYYESNHTGLTNLLPNFPVGIISRVCYVCTVFLFFLITLTQWPPLSTSLRSGATAYTCVIMRLEQKYLTQAFHQSPISLRPWHFFCCSVGTVSGETSWPSIRTKTPEYGSVRENRSQMLPWLVLQVRQTFWDWTRKWRGRERETV